MWQRASVRIGNILRNSTQKASKESNKDLTLLITTQKNFWIVQLAFTEFPNAIVNQNQFSGRLSIGGGLACRHSCPPLLWRGAGLTPSPLGLSLPWRFQLFNIANYVPDFT